MIEYILILIINIITVEAVVEIITESYLFEKFRNFVKSHNNFIGYLFSCPHCFSVWVSIIIVWLIPDIYNMGIIWYIPHIFVIHRCSNILHSFINPKMKYKPQEIIIYNMEDKKWDEEIENTKDE